MTDPDVLRADPTTLGVVGGGQLGRMLAAEIAPLGVETVVLDPTPDCPASAVARDQVVADFDDHDAIEALAGRVDALTFEIELADPDALAAAGEAAGVPVHPSPETLATIQDKLVQKRALVDRGVPVPPFRAVETPADLRDACAELGYPAMLKARRGGYDGRGNVRVDGPGDAEDAVAAVGGEAMVEAFVDFERELSVMAVQGDGERAAFPVAENVHREQILRENVAPARTDPSARERAREVALDVVDALSGRGAFGVELFETGDGEILVNEIAPRPHNSGHYTIKGCSTSQFEQHGRAVLGYPLGATDLRCPTAVANVLGDVDQSDPVHVDGVEAALEEPGVALHWYGKREARPLRKMGHLTAIARDGDGPGDVLDRVRRVRNDLSFAPGGTADRRQQ